MDLDKINRRGLKEYDPILIEWVDITERQGWHDKDDDITLEEMECVTVCQYLKHDESTLTTIQCRTSSQYGTRTRFPLSVIQDIKKLK